MSYNEEDTKLHLITPALQAAGWRGQQLTMEYPITAGQIVLQGDGHRQLAPSYADYLLRYAETLPIAVVEAKEESKAPGAGLQQAKEYAEKLELLFIIDEAHRSGFGTWNDILKHHPNAIQLDMTATPKRTDNIDTYAYFGEPVFTYSLGQGIDDGFLANYKVHHVRSNLDRDGLSLQEAQAEGAHVYVPDDATLRDEYLRQTTDSAALCRYASHWDGSPCPGLDSTTLPYQENRPMLNFNRQREIYYRFA